MISTPLNAVYFFPFGHFPYITTIERKKKNENISKGGKKQKKKTNRKKRNEWQFNCYPYIYEYIRSSFEMHLTYFAFFILFRLYHTIFPKFFHVNRSSIHFFSFRFFLLFLFIDDETSKKQSRAIEKLFHFVYCSSFSRFISYLDIVIRNPCICMCWNLEILILFTLFFIFFFFSIPSLQFFHRCIRSYQWMQL